MTLSEEQREVGGNWECMSQIQPPNTAASASWEDYLSRHMILLRQTQETERLQEKLAENERPLSPGMKYKHYAPNFVHWL